MPPPENRHRPSCRTLFPRDVHVMRFPYLLRVGGYLYVHKYQTEGTLAAY